MTNSHPLIERLEARIAPAFAATIELGALSGADGFQMNGEAGLDYAGWSVSDAGDVNGDGFGDLLVGAKGAPNNVAAGATYVVFGHAGAFAASLNLSALDGATGFQINGEAANDKSGSAVSAAGDVNGDGFGDLIIGAPEADVSGTNSGAAYVVFGHSGTFPATLELSTLSGADGFQINPEAGFGFAGRSVSGAGDVNGDGFDDVVIGADEGPASAPGKGVSYVVFGHGGTFAATFALSSLSGVNGFRIFGEATSDHSGRSVSGAGDLNGDGFDDVFIGAPTATPNPAANGSGASYVVFGHGGTFAANVNLSALNGTNGFQINGEEVSDVAGTVSDAGDINGDGFGDLLIGGTNARPNGSGSGVSYVVFGKGTAFPATFLLSSLDGANGFQINGEAQRDFLGYSVSAAGDVNGDGVDDLIVGADGADPNGQYSGASYVVFGHKGTFPAVFDLTTLDGRNGFQVSGELGHDSSGRAVSGAGDINGDGFDDVVIGAKGSDIGGTYSGAAYVVFGRSSATTISVGDASIAEGQAGSTALSFAVTLSEASAEPISVHVATADGSAQSGSDYTGIADQLVTFAPGEMTKIFAVDVLGDGTFEADEVFTVVLSTPTNAIIADAVGVGTILNDDSAPAISIADAETAEGDSGTTGLVFTVTLSAASSQTVGVSLSTSDGTATAGSDYTAINGQLVEFAPGQTSKTVTVNVLGDTIAEQAETFSVLLANPTNATVSDGSGLGTILNDDPLRLLVKLSPNGRKATFTDVDGDIVKVKTNRGPFTQDDFLLLSSGTGGQLRLLDLAGNEAFNGAKISIVAKTPNGVAGDGLVDLGHLNASGVDLGKVKIDGDLGQIDAGDGDVAKPAFKSLKANSMGLRGLATQGLDGSLQSDLAGDVGTVVVKSGIDGATLAVLGRLGSLKVGGDLADSSILARGALQPGTESNAVAIRSVTVNGNVARSQILAGYDAAGTGVNADVRVGPVSIAGNWSASSLIAGAVAGPDGLFGTADDALISGGNAVVARIASIVIKGTATGTAAEGDHFGFVAQEIAAFEAGGVRLALTPGAGNDLAGQPVGESGDLRVLEVA